MRAGASSPTTGLSDGANTFDFAALSTVDVVRGADSSRIGPGAMGGALVLRTLEPEDLIDPEKGWGGVAKLGYDSSDKSLGGSLAVAKKIENTSVLFQGAYKKVMSATTSASKTLTASSGPRQTLPISIRRMSWPRSVRILLVGIASV